VTGNVVRIDKDEVQSTSATSPRGSSPERAFRSAKSVDPREECRSARRSTRWSSTKEDQDGRLIMSKKRGLALRRRGVASSGRESASR